MPFTVSHAAAALPLRRLAGGRLPLAAMMIGAMAPDFAYFATLGRDRLATHSIAGLFWFCLPVGLAVWLFFVRVLERPTVALLPEPWRTRFTYQPERLTLRALALASVAVILGALTHIAWDSFTHSGSPVVEALPFLRAEIFRIDGQPVHVSWMLQHVSSLFGGVVLLFWAWRTRLEIPAARPVAFYSAEITNRGRMGAALALFVTACAIAVSGYFSHPWVSFEDKLFFLAMGGMKGAIIAWTAIAVFVDRYLRAARHLPALETTR